MIAEFYRLEATNTDVLKAPSRLAAIPYNGTLILEMQAQQSDGTNQFTVTVQLPDGSTPIENMIIPDGATDGALNADDKYTIAVPATAGGHILVSATEGGTAVMMIRATLMP
jgi:hypothetical protein